MMPKIFGTTTINTSSLSLANANGHLSNATTISRQIGRPYQRGITEYACPQACNMYTFVKVKVRQNLGICNTSYLHQNTKYTLLTSAWSYHGLNFIRGIGQHVKVTVSKRNGFRPHLSDNAPIRGAAKNDKNPWQRKQKHNAILVHTEYV